MEHRGQNSSSGLALAGTILFLMELIFIIPFYKAPPGKGASAGELAAFYAAQRTDILTWAFGVSAAILGVLLFAAALRGVLRQAGGAGPLADFAFACAIVATALETTGLLLATMAANVATTGEGAPVAVVIALQGGLGVIPSIPRVVFVFTASLAMLTTRVLPGWIGWVGLVAAVAYGAGSIAQGYEPESALGLLQFGGWLLTIAWMLGTGIVLFRRSRAATGQVMVAAA